jgi:hypothetical protein
MELGGGRKGKDNNKVSNTKTTSMKAVEYWEGGRKGVKQSNGGG